MKIGFSSAVCPGWDLETIVRGAATMGFAGVELRGLRGELHLPAAAELAGEPERVRQLLAEQKVELVCLGTSVTLDSRKPRVVAQQKAVAAEFMELASRLGCPNIRMFVGEIQRWDNRRAALSRIAAALSSLVPVASRYGVTVLVENGGDFPGSDDLWFLVDAVGHPAVQVCWNQSHARVLRERPTSSIPRLCAKIGLVHLADAAFDEAGTLLEYKPLGQGDGEVLRQLELLRGLAYQGYVIFEWPKLWVESLPGPETALPAAAQFLRQAIEAKQPVLSAYKGDKQAPRYIKRPAAAPPAAAAS